MAGRLPFIMKECKIFNVKSTGNLILQMRAHSPRINCLSLHVLGVLDLVNYHWTLENIDNPCASIELQVVASIKFLLNKGRLAPISKWVIRSPPALSS